MRMSSMVIALIVALAGPARSHPLDAAVAAGHHWRFATANGPVHVWVPAGYHPATAITLVYVHGLYTSADEAWVDYELPEQFALSGVNAMFVVCEAPGKFGDRVSWPSLAPLLDTVATRVDRPMPAGEVVAVGHSGAWMTMSGWLDDDALTTVVMFDAAYGDVDRFRAWIAGAHDRRLIDVGDDSQLAADALHRTLPETITLDGFPTAAGVFPARAHDARILYIRSSVGHMKLVTGATALPMILREVATEILPDAPIDLPLGKLPRPIAE
ncbi:MAG TPA: hypothetical protein VL463_06545 [Kofleriaceae bacterium]|nr:hypothetical protein [Kofleriaceae bacterium]